jgi:hypothetical protein
MTKALSIMLLIQAVISPPVITTPPGSAAVEQVSQGARAHAVRVSSLDGLGLGFEGPQGSAAFSNPSDNSLAVGPNHVAGNSGQTPNYYDTSFWNRCNEKGSNGNSSPKMT